MRKYENISLNSRIMVYKLVVDNHWRGQNAMDYLILENSSNGIEVFISGHQKKYLKLKNSLNNLHNQPEH